MYCCLVLVILFAVFGRTSAYPQEGLQREIQKDLREAENIVTNTADGAVEAIEKLNHTLADETEICEDILCNDRGTCIGTKDTHFCICKLGFTGLHCENAPCDSARDCNGKGLCIGTSNSYTCMCQFGITGDHCENSA